LLRKVSKAPLSKPKRRPVTKVSAFWASIDQQCFEAGLADEIVIHLTPILLGKGVRLFDHLGAEAIELERTEAVSTTGMTSLRFRVMKS
jgi:dihydrofolate reductase